MKNNLLPAINKALVYLVLAFAFLLPVFHLPITVEFFEFNKLALSVVATLVLLTLWGVKILMEGKVELAKSPINLPILGIVVANLASGYFSINKSASVLGPFGRWAPSILLITTGALLYFALISNVRSKET